ncbi:PREDICTED: acetylserotonin O-methyltransferase isoform X3 [Poecilia mexicana]|uniref:acetylserotonin O-methyltransferase isoform X3 n=1 Tax=Poecilia mexicana TaxID=48701 RepID=UPI00072E5579|nr:PREDICTED: acetylserotonin O-methyltransferase isoform X3 [Poecilia mexicana]XP_016529361.1 PREDICTED: acetylserotonin O-methyltransferase isoform X3 [Poecilia formosa]
MAELPDAGPTKGAPTTPATDVYPRKILEYMEGFLISKTVFTSCELGVFDVLLAAERPLSAEEISQAVGASLDGTQRLLAACAGLQLLNTHWDNGQVFYSNTEQSRVFLTRSSPLSLCQSIQYSSRTIYLCWHYLTDAVREGRNQYEKAFGVSSKDLFQALYRSDEEMVKFMHLMNSIWNICGRDVVTAFDLMPFKVICDLGGDFFKDSLPVADLYILARILHDWTDERCIELLCRIYKACKPGSAVLLVEALLNEDGSGPLTAQLYSLNMLVQTEGRERTGAQYAALLAASGFTNIQHRLTGKIYDAVLGHKET